MSAHARLRTHEARASGKKSTGALLRSSSRQALRHSCKLTHSVSPARRAAQPSGTHHLAAAVHALQGHVAS